MGIHGAVKQNRYQWLSIFVLILLTSFWVFAAIAYAQGDTQRKTKKDFVWSVKTGKNTMYLLGSLHLLRSDPYPLDKKIEDAYRDCTRIVFETDIDSMRSPVVQDTMMTLGLYPEGQTLKQNITKQTYSLLEKNVVAAGLTMEPFDRFKPWFCSLMLVALELNRLGFNPQYGVDAYFFNKAKQDGKEMIFLETVEYQLGLFTEMYGHEGESFLRQSLEDLTVMETVLPTIVKAWEDGDADTFDSFTHISYKDYPDIYKRFFVQRNKEWIKKIEDLIKQGGTVLVIVGAGHLVGSENVLQLLKDRGYTVKQITAEASSPAVSQQMISGLLYTYRSLSDAQLKGYIAFAKSGIGTKYYLTVAKGVKEALLDGSIHLGCSITDMAWKRRQGL